VEPQRAEDDSRVSTQQNPPRLPRDEVVGWGFYLPARAMPRLRHLWNTEWDSEQRLAWPGHSARRDQ